MMYVVQCRQSVLAEAGTLPLLSMTTQDAVPSTFSRARLKSQDKFKQFKKCVPNDRCQNIASLWSDNRGEYLSHKF